MEALLTVPRSYAPLGFTLSAAISIFGCTGCSEFSYQVEIANRGEQGVLLLQLGEEYAKAVHDYYGRVGISFPIVAGIPPGSHGFSAVQVGQFVGHEESLPDTVDVSWQLADLTSCKVSRPDASYPGGVDKSQCEWRPIRDKIYHRALDLRPIKQSAEYKRTGDRNKAVSMSYFTLRIELIFDGETVSIETRNGATNPWK
jgi:hypothetical protein